VVRLANLKRDLSGDELKAKYQEALMPSILDRLERAESERQRQEWQEMHRRGVELVTAPGPRQAFELQREDARLRDRYGRNPLGQNLLLARRLVEAGGGFGPVQSYCHGPRILRRAKEGFAPAVALWPLSLA